MAPQAGHFGPGARGASHQAQVKTIAAVLHEAGEQVSAAEAAAQSGEPGRRPPGTDLKALARPAASQPGGLVARDRGEHREAPLHPILTVTLGAFRHVAVVLGDVHHRGELLLTMTAEELVVRHRFTSPGW